MQRVYEPQDLLEAHMLVGMLASEGILASIQGEHLLGAMGELPALGLLALFVPAAELQRARELIDEYNRAEPIDVELAFARGDGSGELLC